MHQGWGPLKDNTEAVLYSAHINFLWDTNELLEGAEEKSVVELPIRQTQINYF